MQLGIHHPRQILPPPFQKFVERFTPVGMFRYESPYELQPSDEASKFFDVFYWKQATLTLTGSISIPLLLTMKASHFPDERPKTHTLLWVHLQLRFS